MAGNTPSLKSQWEANRAEFERLCTEQEGLYSPEFERVFTALYELAPDQREVYNTNGWDILADLPEAIDTDTINRALSAAGASDEVRRDFTRYAEVVLQGKRLMQQNALLNAELEKPRRLQEEQPWGWRFFPINIIASPDCLNIVAEVLGQDAQEGEGLYKNATEIKDLPDVFLDSLLGVEAYSIKCSFTPYLDELRRYGVTGITLTNESTRLLFTLLKGLADHIKDNTNKPEAVKSKILAAVKEFDAIPIWGLIIQIMALQGLCSLLENCTLKEGDDGYNEALSLYCWLQELLADKLLNFTFTPYSDGDKQRLKPLCDYLYSTEIGRAVQEAVFNRPHPEAGTPDLLRLPDGLNTDRARKYFARAVEVGYMKPTATGYKWEYGGKRGALARLGYFVERVYCPTNTEQLPEQVVNKLFGVERIGSAITQVHNAKKPQKWRAEIDKLFND